MKDSDNLPIYLDYAATSPLDPGVFEAMKPYFLQNFGNAASRFHAYGWFAEEAVEQAKGGIAKFSGFDEKEIIFTSGATESINLALKGFFEQQGFKGSLITVKTEHKATLDTASHLQKMGVDVVFLDVDKDGNIDLEELENSFSEKGCLLAIMQVNNETGLVLPLREIIALAHRKEGLVHVDATQGVGKLPLPKKADMISFSGHKIYGPKGMGGLLVRKQVGLVSQMHGGGHQRNRRSGTLNVPGIVGLGKAFELAETQRQTCVSHLEGLGNRLERGILGKLDFVEINSAGAGRVPGISNMLFKGMDGEEILLRMNRAAVSNGSACNSAGTAPSHVLKAMGRDNAEAYASIRFSLGKYTTESEIEKTIAHVCDTVNDLKHANF